MPYEMACAGEWFCEEVNAIFLSLALFYLNFCGASFFGVTLRRSNIHYSCLIVSRVPYLITERLQILTQLLQHQISNHLYEDQVLFIQVLPIVQRVTWR